MDPAGKVALVTGGASGIGLAICRELLDNNVKGLVICDVNKELGNKTLGELRKKYGSDRVIFIGADVRNNNELEDAFKEAKKSFGQLDIVCNNAGIFDDVNWEKEVDINLSGVIRGILLAFKFMGKNNGNKGGVVLNTGSTASLEALDLIPIYCGVKHGVMGLTRAFGTPLHFNKTGVRVVAICPGYTESSITPSEGGFLYEELRKEFIPVLNKCQPAECVGRGAVQIIREAPNGSLWMADKGEPIYQVAIPPLDALRV